VLAARGGARFDVLLLAVTANYSPNYFGQLVADGFVSGDSKMERRVRHAVPLRIAEMLTLGQAGAQPAAAGRPGTIKKKTTLHFAAESNGQSKMR
jgi:hypothetical protein